MHMGLPVKVQGHDPDGGTWTEMTMTEDAYWGGAGFMLRHPVVKGTPFSCRFPFPSSSGRYSLANPAYDVYSRSCATR